MFSGVSLILIHACARIATVLKVFSQFFYYISIHACVRIAAYN